LLLGPPGAGKGTQGERISDRLGIPVLATGNVLRNAVRNGTDQGLAAKAYMNRGDLVPDAVILGIIKEALAQPEMKGGVILDGVVRTVAQAEGLSNALADLGRHLDTVLLFEVTDEDLVRRLGGRTVCERCQTPYTGMESGSPCPKPGCGGTVVRRMDDEPQAITTRMKAYRAQTAPVIDWYRGQGSKAASSSAKANGTRVLTVDAAGAVDEVTQRVLRQLEE
ncbi:MAG: nucleoside monophosphate kinase, partial [Anaerolineae bacterium]|nr:nucleoside monophosphate kinase [Gemmatimonadaceae bacterium]